MRFHAEALGLAVRQGVLERPEVGDRRRHLPDWLAELQSPGGWAAMEQSLGVVVPTSLQEFWGLPDLVCLLDAWGELAYVSHALLSGPEIWSWAGRVYWEFAMHGHSGESWMVEISGDAAPMVWRGFLDPVPAKATGERFSAFILGQVRQGIAEGGPVHAQHRCHAYHVRLVPLPGGQTEDLVAISAYVGQSVRDLVRQQYPGREVLSIRRQVRVI